MNPPTEEGRSLLAKCKEWLISGKIVSGSVYEEDEDRLHWNIYSPDSGFSLLPTFHVVCELRDEGSLLLRVLAYNEKLLKEEILSSDMDLRSSVVLNFLYSRYPLKLCSGVIDLVSGKDLLIEMIGSKKVYRSETCSYILTKEDDVCCWECSHLNSVVVRTDDLVQKDHEEDFILPRPVLRKKKKVKMWIDSSSLESEKAPYHCEICFNVFAHKGHYKIHLATHDEFQKLLDESTLCPLCPSEISSKLKLNRHIKDHHPEKNEELCCFVCFKFVKNLAVHLSNAHDSRTVICAKCGKTVRQRYYGEHLSHSHGQKEDRRVICPVCGKIICRKSNLALHIKIMHSDESENVLACETCGKAFPHIKALKKHIEVHQEKKFKCKLCEYRTYRKSNVAVHVKKSHHIKENMYGYVLDTSLSSINGETPNQMLST